MKITLLVRIVTTLNGWLQSSLVKYHGSGHSVKQRRPCLRSPVKFWISIVNRCLRILVDKTALPHHYEPSPFERWFT